MISAISRSWCQTDIANWHRHVFHLQYMSNIMAILGVMSLQHRCNIRISTGMAISKLYVDLGVDCMRWAVSFVARYAILHHFIKTQSVVHSVKIASLLHELRWKPLALPFWVVFEKRASLVDEASSSHVIIQPGLSMN